MPYVRFVDEIRAVLLDPANAPERVENPELDPHVVAELGDGEEFGEDARLIVGVHHRETVLADQVLGGDAEDRARRRTHPDDGPVTVEEHRHLVGVGQDRVAARSRRLELREQIRGVA